MDRLEYRAEPKRPAQFGSISGSEIHNLPFSLSGIISLYRPEPKAPAKMDRYLVRRYKTYVSVATLGIRDFCRSLRGQADMPPGAIYSSLGRLTRLALDKLKFKDGARRAAPQPQS